MDYVTVADAGYLPRLKVLHASMLRHCGDFTLHVLPWDAGVEAWANSATNVQPWKARALYWLTTALPGPRRSVFERMWSARSDLTASLLEQGADAVCQLDADLMFFSSPAEAFASMRSAPAALMPHYFARAADGYDGITEETHASYGYYNSGFVFCRDARLARVWAEQCRSWCYFRLEDGKFADQPYLQDWAAHGARKFGPSVAPGPWTTKGYDWRVRIDAGEIWCTGVAWVAPLVAWHFSSVKLGPDGKVRQLANPEYALAPTTAEVVYAPYVAALEAAVADGGTTPAAQPLVP